jgi:hypothetical protein
MTLRLAHHKHPLVSVAELDTPLAAGTPVLVSVVLDRNAGPHHGVLVGAMPSGRLSVRVERAGRVWRLLTEPTNVYPLPEGDYR